MRESFSAIISCTKESTEWRYMKCNTNRPSERRRAQMFQRVLFRWLLSVRNPLYPSGSSAADEHLGIDAENTY
jgi:hypothetical protein